MVKKMPIVSEVQIEDLSLTNYSFQRNATLEHDAPKPISLVAWLTVFNILNKLQDLSNKHIVFVR